MVAFLKEELYRANHRFIYSLKINMSRITCKLELWQPVVMYLLKSSLNYKKALGLSVEPKATLQLEKLIRLLVVQNSKKPQLKVQQLLQLNWVSFCQSLRPRIINSAARNM